MSAAHLFRTVLVALASPSTFSPALLMRHRPLTETGAAAEPPAAKAWRKAGPAVFVDPTGWLNLAASLSAAGLAQARDCAARCLQLLRGGSPEAFGAVFLLRRRQAALCDYWVHVRLPPAQRVPTPDAGSRLGSLGHGTRELLQDVPAWR